jgi:hypothetical protein
MSKCDELRKLLLEWGEDNYLPLKKKIAYLENENYIHYKMKGIVGGIYLK